MIKGSIRYAAFILPFLIAALAFTVRIPEGADAAGPSIGTINLLPDTKTLDVHPGTSGIVSFYGEISVTNPIDIQAQYMTLDLYINADPWEATELPTLIVMPGMNKVNFTFSIIVPHGVPYAAGNNTVHEFIIGGSWAYEPDLLFSGDLEEKNFMILAKQYYQYSLSMKKPYIQTSPGGTFELELMIENNGNGDDQIVVDIHNREGLEADGWSFQMFRSDYDLKYGETIVVRIPVTTPIEWRFWKNDVTQIHFVVFSSQASAGVVSESVSYYAFIRQRGASIPGFGFPLMLLSGLAVILIGIKRRR
ncbi:MAG: choice-of-anchor T family protein [Thermoplasmatota archaeon]